MKINADYIRGFADADGGWTNHGVTLNNTDLNLLRHIQRYLQTLKIKSRLNVHQQGNCLPCGRLTIIGLPNLVRYAIRIGFAMQRKQQPLENYIKHLTRPRRPYNPEDYDRYCKLKAEGTSYRKMAAALDLSSAAIDRREKRGTYPLDETVLRGIRKIRAAGSDDG